MFETFDAVRRREEAAAWRREQDRGKAPFMLRSTLAIAAVLALLGHPLLHRHFATGAPYKAAIVVLSYALYLLSGYLLSLLAWRRGRRLTMSAPGAPVA
jgi:hypothetical protein